MSEDGLRDELIKAVTGWHLGPELLVDTRLMRVVQARIDAVQRVRELHYPIKRYHDGSGEWSADTPDDIAEERGVDVVEVPFFEVCSHCGYLETWALDEASEMYEYREALWPCATFRALEALDGAA